MQEAHKRMKDEPEILKSAYRNFNTRRIDAVLAHMHPDVQWANGMEGGHVHGHDEVRAYWTRQFLMLDPHVEPLRIELDEQGRWVVEVHQVVHDLAGNLMLDTLVYHVYQFRDGLIQRMDIVQQSSPAD
jgi:hypothetical protein